MRESIEANKALLLFGEVEHIVHPRDGLWVEGREEGRHVIGVDGRRLGDHHTLLRPRAGNLLR